MHRMPIRHHNQLSSFHHAAKWLYGGLDDVSIDYTPVTGRLHTCYSPVRRSPAVKASFNPDAPRLACVRPVASVHPEPGSNSPLLYFNFLVFSFLFGSVQLSFIRSFSPGTSFISAWRVSTLPSVLFPLCLLFIFIAIISMFALFLCPQVSTLNRVSPQKRVQN